MPLRRCSSGDRATRRSGPSTSPATQYGIPQAEYELYAPRSNATISIASPAIRLAWEAALIPAASAPMRMIPSIMTSVHPTALFRWSLGSGARVCGGRDGQERILVGCEPPRGRLQPADMGSDVVEAPEPGPPPGGPPQDRPERPGDEQFGQRRYLGGL